MATTVVRIRAPRGKVLKLINRLPKILAGRARDPSGVVKGLQLRVGVAALSSIQKAYHVKAHGGTDEAGVKWPELSPITLALRRVRISKDALDRMTKRVKKLDRKAHVRFWKIERQQYYFLTGRGHHAERRRAIAHLNKRFREKKVSKSEYNRIKRMLQGKLKKGEAEKYAFAQAGALILIDTGLLFGSFTPGVEDVPARPRGQVFNVGAGFIIIGSKVPYAGKHQKGDPQKKLPRREIIPDRIPDKWWADWMGALKRGLVSASFWESYLRV